MVRQKEEWDQWFGRLDRAMPRSWNAEHEARSPLARWAQPEEIEADEWRWGSFKPGMPPSILLGEYGGRLIARPDDDRHVITVAGSRAGKGRSLILPNLAAWPGSVIAIDPKGELASKTAAWRRDGLKQNLVVLDPFGVSGQASSSYNPLADLDPTSDAYMDDVALVADALIIDDGGDRHWTDSARNLIRSLILYMIGTQSEAPPTLFRLRNILLGTEGRLSHPGPDDDNPDDFLFLRMTRIEDEYVSRSGHSFMEKSARELGSILSVAREQLAFLDSKAMARVLEPSSFRLRSVKATPTTIYMCLPASRLATHFRWLRIIVNLSLAALEAEGQGTNPTLLLLEEFAVLQHMESVEKAAGQIAGFGVKLWAILQDLGQLKAIYKERWETFLGNAGITTWFGLNDQTSLEYVSNRLGDTHFVRREKTEVTMNQRGEGAAEYKDVYVNEKLLSPEEVGRLLARETGRILILHPGSRPRVLRRLDASDDMFRGKIAGEESGRR
jgi:type IV secretion system protein VirD4